MLLTVENERVGTVLHIKMKGTLDFSTVDSFNFENEMVENITEIMVDFSELEFIDSTGIGAILTILHTASSMQASVTFVNISEETEELFETIGVFTIKKSLLGEE